MSGKASSSFAFFVLLIIFSFSLFGLQGCNSKKRKREPQIFYGTQINDVKTWDPANAYDTESNNLVPAIYETLYQYKYLSDSYQIEPLLANSLPIYSADRLTLKIPIKRGITFQQDPCFKTPQKTRELKADDFVYALKRLALPSLQSPGWWILNDRFVGINHFRNILLNAKKKETPRLFNENIEGIQALDDHTLQLKLSKPYPQLLFILSMPFTSPVPKEAVQAYSDEKGNLSDHPIGTGPFLLEKWDRDNETVLTRNPRFRKELYPNFGAPTFQERGLLADSGKQIPFLEEIHIQIIKKDQPRWLNFQKAKLDVIQLPKDNFNQTIIQQVNLAPELVKQGIRLSLEADAVIRFISFNMRDKIVGQNKLLRQALSSALDRDQWIALHTNGTGRKMVNSLPPGIQDRPSTSKIKYDFDLKVAKSLIAKAGYPGGNGLPKLQFDLRGTTDADLQLGEMIKKQWGRIGVQLNVIPNPFSTYLDKAKKGELQISYGGWSLDYPDAENVFQLLYGPNQAPGPGEANFDHPFFNEMFKELTTLETGPKHAELIQKMDDLIQEECPWAFGFYETGYFLSQPWLMNYRGNQLINNRIKYYKISSEIKARYLE